MEDQLIQLVQRIAPHGKLLRTWQLKGGISAAMMAFEIEYADGQRKRMVLRQPNVSVSNQNPHTARHEFQLLQFLKSAGAPVATPYYLDESKTLFNSPYLVLEYVEGEPEFAPRHPERFALQFAEHLAKTHKTNDRNLTAFLRYSNAQLGTRPAAVDDSLDEGRIRDVLESAWPQPQRNAPTLLHGDFWPGNVLWQGDRLVAVIDWEDAAIGDPLMDLAISRLDLSWIIGANTMATFTQHYQSLMPIDYTNLAYWDLFAALRLIRMAGSNLSEWAAFFHPYGRNDITEQTVRSGLRAFVVQAFHVLDQR